MVGDERAAARRDTGRKTLHEMREDEAGDAMIGFLKRHVWPWSEIERLKRERMAERDRRDLLELLDYTDLLVRFCSAHMPDVQKYYDGSNAFWSVAHRIAGNDKIADRLRDEIGKNRKGRQND